VPRPGFPRNLQEFQRQFATETACYEYLAVCRWPDSLRNGAVIGAAIGVGYVLGVLAYLAGGEGGEPSSANWITGPLIGAGLGAGVGALVDLARGGQKRLLIYAAARAQ